MLFIDSIKLPQRVMHFTKWGGGRGGERRGACRILNVPLPKCFQLKLPVYPNELLNIMLCPTFKNLKSISCDILWKPEAINKIVLLTP